MRSRSPSDAAADRLRLLERASPLLGFGAWECDLATERLTWTRGVHAIFDYPEDIPLVRSNIVDLYLDESRRDMERMRAEAIRSGDGFTLDVRIRIRSGPLRWMRLSVEVENEDGRPVRIFGAKQDITADRERLDRLRLLAERDTLTGLANRAVFDERYRAVVQDTVHHGDVSALVLIDLDRFKPINDTYGHLAGDACLAEVAQRLRQTVRHATLVARIGGDEFAVLLPAPLGRARIGRIAEQIATVLRRPFIWNGRRLDMSCSVGVALVDRPSVRRHAALFMEADAALYAAKSAGGGSIAFFGEEPSAAGAERRDFRKAS